MDLNKLLEKLIYRDIIYIISGFIILFYIGYLINIKESYLTYLNTLNDYEFSTHIFLLLIGVAYLLALFSQTLLQKIFPTKLIDRKEYALKLSKITNNNILTLLDRCINFKQIGATLGSSLSVVFVLIQIKFFLLVKNFDLSIFKNIFWEIFITDIILTIMTPIFAYILFENTKQEEDILSYGDNSSN